MMSSEDDGAGGDYNSGSVYGNSHRRQQQHHEMDTNVQPIYHYPNGGGGHTRISQMNGSHSATSSINGRTGSVANNMIQQHSSTNDHLRIRGSSSTATTALQNGTSNSSLQSPTAGPTTSSTATHNKKRSSLGAWSTGSDDDHPFLYAVNTQPRMFMNDSWNDGNDDYYGTSGGRPRYSKRIWMVAFSLLVLTSAMLLNAFTTFRSTRRIQYSSNGDHQQQEQQLQGQYYQQQQQSQEQQQPQIVADDIQLQQQQPEPQQSQEYLEWMSTEGLQQSPILNEQEQQKQDYSPPHEQQHHQQQEDQQQSQEEESIIQHQQQSLSEEEHHIQQLLEPFGFPKDHAPIFQNVRTLQEVLGGNHVPTLEETGDIIFFWHIPKAAGSTLKDMLDFCYDKVRAEKVRDPPSLDIVQVTERHKLVNVDTNYTDAIQLAKQMHLLDSDVSSEESPIPVQVQTIVSSYLWDASTLFTPHHKGRMITILRHPIERDISMFHYLQKATWEPTYDKTLKHLTLMDYATNHKHGDNWMVRYLTHDKRGKITNEHVEYATQLLQTYCLLGFVHHSDKTVFEKSIKRIETYLQIQPVDTQCVEQYTQGIGVNVNSRHNERQIEEDQHPMEGTGTPEWNALAELHQFDLILWNNAQRIYQEQGQQLLGGME